uniref:Uncharacterized protein n=1 Tax=Anopheles coluzzii TaxID=1518534 RepID=A0A8W7PAM4_ANOCL
LKEELHRREMCEEQIEMLVNMYEQQSVELNQLKRQVHTFDRSSQDRLFDESTEDHDGSQTTETLNVAQDDDGGIELVETISFEKPAACLNCPENLKNIEDLKREIASLQAQTASQPQSISQDNADAQKQLMDLRQELTDCKRQLQESAAAAESSKSSPQVNADQQQQMADLRRELTDCQRQLKEATDQYEALRASSTADGQELERVKLQLEQLASVSDAPAGQLELFAANEKLSALQKENEKLQKELSESKARIVELEKKVQSAASSVPAAPPTGGECCAEKVNKISELEQTISRLKDDDASKAVVSASPAAEASAENANLLQRITSLEKELLERDQKLRTLQEAVDRKSVAATAEATSVDGAEMSSLLSQLAEKNELIKRLQDKLDTVSSVPAAADDDGRACQEELAELRVRLEACEGEAAARLVSDALPEPRKSVRISDEVEEFEPLSIKEELGSEQDEKETEEIKAEPSDEQEEEEEEESDNGDNDGSQTSVGHKKRLNSSLEKLEQLQESLSKRCTLAAMMGRQPGVECDCIQAIAFKIAQGGLEVLLVAELYVLLQEICSAITRKNAVLGRNVTVLANSMTKCWQVITDARVMMNMELTNRTSHHQSVTSVSAHCMSVQEVREGGEEAGEEQDNRTRTASHTAGHLSRPSGWVGTDGTRPSTIPPHQSMSVGSDDNRHSNALDVQRRRTIKWMENVKKSGR